MDVKKYLWDHAGRKNKSAMPILSFPAAQKLNVTVEELVSSSELQARAIETVAAQTETIAAVSLMDLSVEAEAFGAEIRFSPNEVPAVVGRIINDTAQAEALSVPPLDKGRALVCVEGVRLAKQRIKDKPVFAGMIGPYSLAGRLLDVTEIMYLCFDEPETVSTVLDKVTQYLINYGAAFKEAGADGIIIAEPLAGLLNAAMAEEFSVPYFRRIVEALQDEDFAVIYHNCGNSTPRMLDEIYSQNAAAYHFGNSVNMAEILSKTPSDILCMGNIDPVSQFVDGTPQTMTEAVKTLLDECGAYDNFIVSSGCDIPFNANWDNIEAFFSAVSE